MDDLKMLACLSCSIETSFSFTCGLTAGAVNTCGLSADIVALAAAVSDVANDTRSLTIVDTVRKPLAASTTESVLLPAGDVGNLSSTSGIEYLRAIFTLQVYEEQASIQVLLRYLNRHSVCGVFQRILSRLD
jgi:hypothetical protein